MVMVTALRLLPRLKRSFHPVLSHAHSNNAQVNPNLLKVLTTSLACRARVVACRQILSLGAGKDKLTDHPSEHPTWVARRRRVGEVSCSIEVLDLEFERFLVQVSDDVVHDMVLELDVLKFIS